MLPPTFHDALGDFLLAADARTRSVLARDVVERWLTLFRAARNRQSGGTISRGGLYQRVFMLLALELWMRDHGLTW